MLEREEQQRLEELAKEIRIATLEEFATSALDIGGAMSIVELLAVLYGKVMRYKPEEPAGTGGIGWCFPRPRRACFVCNPCPQGFFPYDMLKTLNQGNKPSQPCGPEQDTGGGHDHRLFRAGMSTGLGVALGRRWTEGQLCLPRVRDGECQEGQICEGPTGATPNWITSSSL